jgi:hypothetical protein
VSRETTSTADHRGHVRSNHALHGRGQNQRLQTGLGPRRPTQPRSNSHAQSPTRSIACWRWCRLPSRTCEELLVATARRSIHVGPVDAERTPRRTPGPSGRGTAYEREWWCGRPRVCRLTGQRGLLAGGQTVTPRVAIGARALVARKVERGWRRPHEEVLRARSGEALLAHRQHASG